MAPKALITGITGQDGSYLAELLLQKGYDVYGIVRRVAIESPQRRLSRIWHVRDRITLCPASLESFASIHAVVDEVRPDECYHLAAQSSVMNSFEDEFSTINVNVGGTHAILAAIARAAPHCKVLFAGSSEMFGNSNQSPLTEESVCFPRSPYGLSKLAGFHMTRHYRHAHGLFAATAISFNHESPRRGLEFVTRKVTMGAARIKHELTRSLALGNLGARRDWGYAGDYVTAMWLILQQERPDDYVLATGITHSVEEWVDLAFGRLGLDWRAYVRITPRLYRPTDIHELLGDASKARRLLGWVAQVRFERLVSMMVDADLALIGSGRARVAPEIGEDDESGLAILDVGDRKSWS
jgi:GDPmannose 4,6-dehydratase